MPFDRRTALWLIVPMAMLSGPSTAEETLGAVAAPVRTWEAPAAAAAAAATTQVAKDTDIPVPVPKPAERPAAKPAPEPAAEKTKPAEKTAPAGTDKKDAKAKDKAKKPVLAAKQLFGTVKTSAPLKARAVGWYAKGCLAGAKPLAVDGPGWQVMRLSRNRMWGHPVLIELVERLAKEATANKEWSGLLVGDISQPRGGPMISGHASHQVGLDADIWLTPMPDHTLTRREREDISATSMLASHDSVNPKVWGDGQVKLIKRAASYTKVERILVHPAIKKALCEATKGQDRSWLTKVRPYFGHFYHFHMRIGCPDGSTNCKSQPSVPDGDGCGAELTDWLKRVAPKKKKPAEAANPPAKPSKPSPKKPEMTLADLPADCKAVLTAGGNVPPTEPAEVIDTSKDAGPDKDIATTDTQDAKKAATAQ